uniref:Uncharacterized protein n=1 Tax=Arundo donax TaxID=35708 RepID=A0A0A9GHN8_ARUDO
MSKHCLIHQQTSHHEFNLILQVVFILSPRTNESIFVSLKQSFF